jgi:hypothetical protein
MSRPSRVRALLPLALLAAAGCQDYNFNPVGQCLLQPGTKRETLSNISTADLLFVVDDSGSMRGEQDKLAANFTTFINNLDQTNAARAARGLDPIDFHIAVTTSSVFWNEQTIPNSTCRNDCPGAGGSLVCCTTTSSPAPLTRARSCAGPGAACPGGTTCKTTCNNLKGDYHCCADDNTVPAAAQEPIPCQRAGAQCGRLEHHYNFPSGCDAGVAADDFPLPQGDFVSLNDNPRVLHFDKQLYTQGTNRQGFTSEQLKDFFVQNVVVGTCGSGQEQALQAARLALTKALSGGQKDTRNLAGQVTWDPTSRVATSPAEWPHENSKLVLVFVGDEDDCSSPADASAGVVWLPAAPGSDACFNDASSSNPKQFTVTSIVDAFTGLGRELGAAFIFPAEQTTCSGESCTPGQCCDTVCTGSTSICRDGVCGGQAPGIRLHEAASTLRVRGADMVVGSICDPRFDILLDEIAEITKPPAGLELPTEPAEGGITFLRIAKPDGQTRRTCKGPAPVGMTGDEAAAADYDWWFTATSSPGDPVAVSKFVYINHETGNCEANPGETYSADYIGLNPEGGCATTDDCRNALGTQTPWTCYTPPGTGRGTCVCGEP